MIENIIYFPNRNLGEQIEREKKIKEEMDKMEEDQKKLLFEVEKDSLINERETAKVKQNFKLYEEIIKQEK